MRREGDEEVERKKKNGVEKLEEWNKTLELISYLGVFEYLLLHPYPLLLFYYQRQKRLYFGKLGATR